MTKTKQNWFINFIKAFTSQPADEEISEEKLSSEERKLLQELREMDKVDNVEASMKQKYGVTVNTAEAKAKAGNKKDKQEEKVIGKE